MRLGLGQLEVGLRRSRVRVNPPTPPRAVFLCFCECSTLCVCSVCGVQASLHKILFHFKAFWGESIIFVLAAPTCKAYPIAILLHGQCAIYDPPPTTRFLCHIPYIIGDGNILYMPICRRFLFQPRRDSVPTQASHSCECVRA